MPPAAAVVAVVAVGVDADGFGESPKKLLLKRPNPLGTPELGGSGSALLVVEGEIAAKGRVTEDPRPPPPPAPLPPPPPRPPWKKVGRWRGVVFPAAVEVVPSLRPSLHWDNIAPTPTAGGPEDSAFFLPWRNMRVLLLSALPGVGRDPRVLGRSLGGGEEEEDDEEGVHIAGDEEGSEHLDEANMLSLGRPEEEDDCAEPVVEEDAVVASEDLPLLLVLLLFMSRDRSRSTVILGSFFLLPRVLCWRRKT